MKDYFIRLFNYDKFANDLILQTILQAGTPKKPVQLMAHLLAAQQIWFNRCKGLPAAAGILWPDWTADTLTGVISDNHLNWLNYLDGLHPGDFEELLQYKSLKGDSFENKLVDVLTHVINHGTHHRAQAGQHLKAVGIEPLPPTDYIFYLRG